MPPPLPDLNQATLDWPTVEQLFADIAACGEVLAVIPKLGPRRHTQAASPPPSAHAAAAMATGPVEAITLAQGLALLRNGAVHGLQIRYRFDGAQWWDTLLAVPGGHRLVRIRHEMDGPTPTPPTA